MSQLIAQGGPVERIPEGTVRVPGFEGVGTIVRLGPNAKRSGLAKASVLRSFQQRALGQNMWSFDTALFWQFRVQIEGGKRNGSGLRVDITGTAGDLKMWNPKSFTNPQDNTIEGARGNRGALERLAIPERLNTIPPSSLDVSVQDLAHLYAEFARDEATEPGLLPEFDHAVRLHRFINRIEKVSESGRRTAVADIWNVASGGE